MLNSHPVGDYRLSYPLQAEEILSKMLTDRHGRNTKSQDQLWCPWQEFFTSGAHPPLPGNISDGLRGGGGGTQEGRVLVVTTESSPLVTSDGKCVVSHVEAECLALSEKPRLCLKKKKWVRTKEHEEKKLYCSVHNLIYSRYEVWLMEESNPILMV